MKLGRMAVLVCWLLGAASARGAVPNGHSAQGTRRGSRKVLVGVLEDVPGAYEGQADYRAVRAVFEEAGGRWKALPSDAGTPEELKALVKLYPREATWTIAFDGKDLGTVKARTPANWDFYSDVGLEKIVSTGRVPTVGQKSAEFGGYWGAPAYRPLVAVSRANFRDPEHWWPSKASPGLVAAVRRRFRAKFPRVENCRSPEENVGYPRQYADREIEVFSSYTTHDAPGGEWALIEVGLTGYNCDGPVEDGGPYAGQWYVRDPGGRVRLIGSDMWLVDAGDYDHNGRSEVMFAVVARNTGGYRLYYDGFWRKAEFVFHYH